MTATLKWPWLWDAKATTFIPVSPTFKDITGQKFGRLTVVYPVSDGRRVRWYCVCDCGFEGHLVTTDNLTSGGVTSCGCRKKAGRYHFGTRWVGSVNLQHLNSYKRGARERKLVYEVSDKYVAHLLEEQQDKCALTGLPIQSACSTNIRTASLDRIDSSKGYIEGNLQWVHKDVNRMKNAFTEARFLEICKLVTERANGKDNLAEN